MHMLEGTLGCPLELPGQLKKKNPSLIKSEGLGVVGSHPSFLQEAKLNSFSSLRVSWT